MAGSSVTITRRKIGDAVKFTFAWVSDDAAGTASGTYSGDVVGQIMRFVTDPGATAPTALYDITIVDENGVDCLNGLGADRSATLNESKSNVDGLAFIAAKSLTFAVANAGNSKVGTAYLTIADFRNNPI